MKADYLKNWERVSKSKDKVRPALFKKAMELERMFVEAGGHLIIGTDPTGFGGVIAGFASKRVIELLVEAGFISNRPFNYQP